MELIVITKGQRVQVSEEAQRYLTGNAELAIVATSRKKKVAVEMERVTVSNMAPDIVLVCFHKVKKSYFQKLARVVNCPEWKPEREGGNGEGSEHSEVIATKTEEESGKC